MMESSDSTGRTLDLFFSLLFLAMGAAGIGWILAMAGGFPIGSLAFWLRWLVCPMVVLSAGIYLVCDSRSSGTPRRDDVKQHLRIGAVVFLAAMMASARYHFPYTIRTWLLMVAVAVLIWLAVAIVKRTRGVNKLVTLAIGAIAISLGIFLPLSQRSLDCDTRPNNSPLEIVDSDLVDPGEATDSGQRVIQWENVEVDFPGKNIVFRNNTSTLYVSPMLEFTSCSPDRCWTVFAPRRYFFGPLLSLGNWSDHEEKARAVYRSLGVPAASWFVQRKDTSTIELDVRTNVAKETYSHLNSFSYFAFATAGKMSLSFSPCSDKKIEFAESDYPIGRPARFAYLDSQKRFHVVEASSAEKGPFTELASGELEQPFTIELYDGDKSVFEIQMNDWAGQASTQVSPTAGWGVPENAIEFRLSKGRASIFVTLAGTSVGRGFHSVGHNNGVYRNRMLIKRLP